MSNLLTADVLPATSTPSNAAPAPAGLAALRPGRWSRAGRERGLVALSWLAPLVLLGAWEAAAQRGGLSPQVLPAPSKLARTAAKLTASGQLPADMAASLARAAIGFVIGGTVGFVLGPMVGFSRIAEALLDRSVQIVRAVPFLAVLPLVIVWLGVGEAAKIFVVSLGVVFPIYINTVLSLRQVDPKLLRLGRVRGLSSW